MREDLAGLCLRRSLEERIMSEVIDVAATTPENEAENKEQESKWIEMQAQEPHSWYFRKRHHVYCQAHCQEVALKMSGAPAR